MRKWLILVVLLTVLAACNGDDEPAPPTDIPPTLVDDTATEEPLEDPPGQVMVPGVRTTDDLEVISRSTYVSPNNIGWIVMEVRNGSDAVIPNVEVTVSLLDDQNRERDFARTISPFYNIPPGYVIPLVLQFTAPTDYTDYLALVQPDLSVGDTFASHRGEFDLPNTVESVSGGDFPVTVTGTVTNDRGTTLITPVVMVTLYDDSGGLLGAAIANLEGLSERGEWGSGATLNFRAQFLFLPSTDIAETRITSAAYSIQ